MTGVQTCALPISEASVAALQVRVTRFQAQVDELRNLVDTIPRVEAELVRLNRDYNVNKKNYEMLLARRESANISEEAGQSSGSVKFRVVDPPHVPLTPAAPNRPLLVSVVLAGSILAGMVFAFFMSQIRPTFDNGRVIARELGVPMLGVVSMVWTGRSHIKRRMEIATFGLGGLMLVALYGAYVAYLMYSGGAV